MACCLQSVTSLLSQVHHRATPHSLLTCGVYPLCSGVTWMTKSGLKQPNYYGSLTQAATVRVGNYKGEEVFTPFKSLLPMVKPEDLVLGGWDISSLNLADAMERAQVCLHGGSIWLRLNEYCIFAKTPTCVFPV